MTAPADDTLLVQPSPERLIEIGMFIAGLVGLLILIAPNFGLKPKRTGDRWRFPVKPTCLLLYYLVLGGGMGAVAFSAGQLLASGPPTWNVQVCPKAVVPPAASVGKSPSMCVPTAFAAIAGSSSMGMVESSWW